MNFHLIVGSIAIIACTVLASKAHHQSKQESAYTIQCAKHKGVAVRDLEEKMRCVPMLGKVDQSREVRYEP